MFRPRPTTGGGRPFRLLFWTNEFYERGCEVAVFDYATHWESLICGEAYIAGLSGLTPGAYRSLAKFEAAFPGRVHIVRNGSEALDELATRLQVRVALCACFGGGMGQSIQLHFPRNKNQLHFPRNKNSRTSLLRVVSRSALLCTPSLPSTCALLCQVDAIYSIQWNCIGATTPAFRPLYTHAVFHGGPGIAEGGEGSCATVSESCTRDRGVPVVHHIVLPHPALDSDARPFAPLELPVPVAPGGRVFCRHGGSGTFDQAQARGPEWGVGLRWGGVPMRGPLLSDIPALSVSLFAQARDAMCQHAQENDKDVFLLMNTVRAPPLAV